MAESEAQPKKFQWRWVGISLLLYVVFYFLPLALIPGGVLTNADVTQGSSTVAGVWAVAGIFIIAAVSGFLSKDVTIWEPAVASFGLVVLQFCAASMKLNRAVVSSVSGILGLLITLALFFGLSYLGAWWGEHIQKASSAKRTSKTGANGTSSQA